jgi:hypothetical protein
MYIHDIYKYNSTTGTLNKTNKVYRIDDISSQFTGITTTLGGSIVGLTSFIL